MNQPLKLFALAALTAGILNQAALANETASAQASLRQSQSATADLITLFRKAADYDSGIAAALAELRANREGENIAFSALLPQIEASASSTHTNSNISPESPLSTDDSYESNSYGVTLSQSLVDFSNWYDLDAAEQDTLVAETQYYTAFQDLILEVAISYFGVLRAQENLVTANAQEAAFKRQYEQAKEQFDVGLIAITAVHEAKASYDASRTDRIQAEGALTLSIEDLSVLTGVYTPSPYTLKADFPIRMDDNVTADDWVQAAYANNLAIKSAEFSLASSKAVLQSRKADHYPTLNLSAGYDYSDFDNLAPRDLDNEDSSIAVNFNLPIYTGGATQSRVRQNMELVSQAQELLTSAQRQARLSARTEYINLVTNTDTVESTRQNIISRESALEATREGYKVGTRNIVEVLDAEREYYLSLSNYANARFDFVESSLRILQAAGTLSVKDLEELNVWLEAPAP